jgi:hypothetical protein
MRAPQEFQERVGRIEKLVQKLEASADPVSRGTARELIQSLMELHGGGLERILEIISNTGGAACAVIVKALGCDDLVSSLLVLHGLHPDDFETRVRRGLDKVRPQLRSRGVSLNVIEIVGDQVRLKIDGPASNELEKALRDALLEAAPDASEVSIEGGVERAPSSSFVPLSSLRSCTGSPVLTASSSRP